MTDEALREAVRAVLREFDQTHLRHDVSYANVADAIDRLRAALTGRTPHRGDAVLLHGDRRTVLDLIDRGSGLLVVAEDDAGLRIERYADRLVWDDDARAWRAVDWLSGPCSS